MIASSLFYWVECDTPGCKHRTPEVDDGISAWSEEQHAVDQAIEYDWVMIGGKFFCEDCVAWCSVCESHLIPKDGSGPCPDCKEKT